MHLPEIKSYEQFFLHPTPIFPALYLLLEHAYFSQISASGLCTGLPLTHLYRLDSTNVTTCMQGCLSTTCNVICISLETAIKARRGTSSKICHGRIIANTVGECRQYTRYTYAYNKQLFTIILYSSGLCFSHYILHKSMVFR